MTTAAFSMRANKNVGKYYTPLFVHSFLFKLRHEGNKQPFYISAFFPLIDISPSHFVLEKKDNNIFLITLLVCFSLFAFCFFFPLYFIAPISVTELSALFIYICIGEPLILTNLWIKFYGVHLTICLCFIHQLCNFATLCSLSLSLFSRICLFSFQKLSKRY